MKMYIWNVIVHYICTVSIILQIPFTVSNCNTLCIMGIFCDVKLHIQRLNFFFFFTVFFIILLVFFIIFYCIFSNCCILLYLPLWRYSIEVVLFTFGLTGFALQVSTTLQAWCLHWTCYIACNDWQIRLSIVSETARALGVLRTSKI